MEFLLWSFVGLAALGLVSTLIVEAGCLTGRIYARWCYWLDYRYRSWQSGRQMRALKRRFGPAKGKSPSFGQLRVTKSRADSLERLLAGKLEGESNNARRGSK